MKEIKSVEIAIVDEKTGEAFEKAVNRILCSLARAGHEVVERQILLEQYRAMFVYETVVLKPENLADALELMGANARPAAPAGTANTPPTSG